MAQYNATATTTKMLCSWFRSWMMLIFLLCCCCTTTFPGLPSVSAQGIGGDNIMMMGGESISTQQLQDESTESSGKNDFHLPADFYVNKCDPCIARSEYKIWVITHGTVQDLYWQQVKLAMEQASRDTGVAVDVQLHDGATTSEEEIYRGMAARIRKAATATTSTTTATTTSSISNNVASNTNTRPDVIVTTLPSNVVHQAVTVALASGMPIFGFHTGHDVAPRIGVLGFVAQDETLAGKMVAKEMISKLFETSTTNSSITIEEDGGGDEEDHTLNINDNNTLPYYVEDNATTDAAFVFNLDDDNNDDNSTETQQLQSRNDNDDSKAITGLIDVMRTNKKRVMYINPFPDEYDVNNAGMLRYRGLQKTLQPPPDETEEGAYHVDMLHVNLNDLFETAQAMNDKVFAQGTCPYDVVVLGGSDPVLVDLALSAATDLGCSSQQRQRQQEQAGEAEGSSKTTQLVTFGISQQITNAIVQGRIAFTAAPQHYMESVFAVVMASMFITTGKKLSLPKETKIYLSGPIVIDETNIPTDSIQTCQEQAFPVCNPQQNDDQPYFDPLAISTGNTASIAATAANSGGVSELLCNLIGCLPRSKIRIGGVLHGVTTDLFWNPVFAAARQAAVDVGVVLDLEQLEPQENHEILHAKMAARIRNLCQGGVDGIFVTIPNDEVADAVRYCRSLNVPVISVNAGGDRVEELDILQHIGQHEYNAGYGAGKQLVQEGMKEGYCLNHGPGNVVFEDRCRGFSDAISEHEDVIYRGMVNVADDNQAQFTLQVETAVEERSENPADAWDGIAILLGGASQMGSALHVSSLHSNVIVGSFDISDSMFVAFAEGKLRFGIDQQPFLQGSLPVFLLTYAAYTQQSLINDVIETGPRFVNEIPSSHEEQCENTFFSICSILPDEDFQMIATGLLAVGYVFVALTVFTACICLGWTNYYRLKSPLVRISQPPFLMTLCFGCIVSILSIIPMGVQTEYRYVKDVTGTLTDEENSNIGIVDASCMLAPWLYSVGFVMVFSSLFAKIWRVQLIFKAGETFRRRTVTLWDIAPYVAVMFVIVLTLLVAWQITDPFRWEREVTLDDSDGYALESTGGCTSDQGWYFWLTILGFQILCLLYALVLCFQTKHIQDDLSESSNVFLAVICIFQVDVIALPISAMIQDDTGVFFFVRACAVFLQNYTVLCLMFGPKMYRTFTSTDDLPSVGNMRSTIRSGANTLRSSLRNSNNDNYNFAASTASQASRVTFLLPGEQPSSDYLNCSSNRSDRFRVPDLSQSFADSSNVESATDRKSQQPVQEEIKGIQQEMEKAPIYDGNAEAKEGPQEETEKTQQETEEAPIEDDQAEAVEDASRPEATQEGKNDGR